MAIILVIFAFLLLKRYIPKRKISIKKYFVSLLVVLCTTILSYKLLYKNEDIYNGVGNTSLINIWIGICQSQIRRLVYPFIYTIKDSTDKKPEDYNENETKNILNKYNYENKFSHIQEQFLNDYDFFDYIIEEYEKSRDDEIPYFNFSVTYQNHGPYNEFEYEGKEYFFDDIGYDNAPITQ